MKRYLAFLVIHLSFSPLFTWAQSEWYEKTATPGAGLTATLIAQESNSASSSFAYFLKASGFPAGGKVVVLVSSLATEADHAIPVKSPTDPMLLDEKPAVVLARSRVQLVVDETGSVLRLDGTVFGVDILHPLPGETFVASLLSLEKKQKIGAFVKITPVPIESKDGPCFAEAILAARAGDSYQIRARGFTASEQVLVARDSRGQVRESRIKANKAGAWMLTIQTGGEGKSSGTLATTIRGQACKLTLLLPWRVAK